MRERITFTEFLEWLEYLQQEKQRVTRSHWYMAQIAAEIRRANVKHPNKVKASDFLLKSGSAYDYRQSKRAWAAFLGVDIGKN